MAKALTFLLMVKSMLENGKKIILMGQVPIHGLMEKNMLDSGKITNKMAKEL